MKALVIKQGRTTRLVIRVQPVAYREQVAGDGALKKFECMAEAGVLTYAVPSLPAGGVVLATMNGQEVGTLVDGVNVTLQGYTPGEIADTDALRFFYTE